MGSTRHAAKPRGNVALDDGRNELRRSTALELVECSIVVIQWCLNVRCTTAVIVGKHDLTEYGFCRN